MAYLVINGTTFNGKPDGTGTAAAWDPTGYKETPAKIGTTLVAADGTRNRVERGTTKHVFDLAWDPCNLATMQALRTIALLTSTFAFVDYGGTSYTVQVEDPIEIDWSKNSPTASFWSVKLKLYEA